jgi:hypothetical protein
MVLHPDLFRRNKEKPIPWLKKENKAIMLSGRCALWFQEPVLTVFRIDNFVVEELSQRFENLL